MEDPQDPEILSPYWTKLGQFVFYYARIEYAIQVTLRWFAGIDDDVAKALLSGVRVRDAIDKIRRTAEENGREIPSYVEEAFKKAGELTTRDRILHHGIYVEPDGAIVTDEMRTIKSRARRTPVSVGALHHLAMDAVSVWARIVVFNRQMRPGRRYPAQKEWEELATNPWLYKPPQPLRAKSKARPPNRQQSDPPQS